MTGLEVKQAMADIANQQAQIYTAKLGCLTKEAKMERKALMISQRAAENCAAFAQIDFPERFYEVRQIRIFNQDIHFFDDYKHIFENLEENNKEAFLVYAFAVAMVRHALYDKRNKKLETAKQHHDVENVETVFVSEIMCKVMDDILNQWKIWWNKNGCVPCEV